MSRNRKIYRWKKVHRGVEFIKKVKNNSRENVKIQSIFTERSTETNITKNYYKKIDQNTYKKNIKLTHLRPAIASKTFS